MFVYVGRSYTATATGQTLRAVVCEACSGEYFYAACRMATGGGTSPYGLDNRGAESRAHSSAQKALDRSLRRAVDVVPCPHCGWLQPDMVRDVRRRRLGWIQTIFWLVPLLLLIPFGLAYVAMIDGPGRDDGSRAQVLAMILGLVGVGVVGSVVVGSIRRRFDPNERLPGGGRVAKLPPAPPALVRTPWPAEANVSASSSTTEEAEPDDSPRTLDYYSVKEPEEPRRARADLRGHSLLLPAPDNAGAASARTASDGWVTVQLLKVGWPHACECCLAQPSATYADAVPFKISQNSAPLPIPVCEACRKKLRGRWWKWVGLTLLGVGVLVTGMYYLLPGVDQVGLMIMCVILGPLAAVIAAPIVAGLASRPHRCRTLDGGRGFYRLWFENPGYAELMARAWAAPETHALAVPDEQLQYLVQAELAARPSAAGRHGAGRPVAAAAR